MKGKKVKRGKKRKRKKEKEKKVKEKKEKRKKDKRKKGRRKKVNVMCRDSLPIPLGWVCDSLRDSSGAIKNTKNDIQ